MSISIGHADLQETLKHFAASALPCAVMQLLYSSIIMGPSSHSHSSLGPLYSKPSGSDLHAIVQINVVIKVIRPMVSA